MNMAGKLSNSKLARAAIFEAALQRMMVKLQIFISTFSPDSSRGVGPTPTTESVCISYLSFFPFVSRGILILTATKGTVVYHALSVVLLHYCCWFYWQNIDILCWPSVCFKSDIT